MAVKRILVVDDDTHTNDLVAETLRLEGFTVLQTSTGADALALLDREKVDLIMLDMMLPDMKGWKLAEEFKKKPQTSGIPIVVISILSPEETDIQKKNQNVLGYVLKPFEISTLVEVVRKMGKP